jgi:hypothetical protein
MNPKSRRSLCRCCESEPGILADPYVDPVCSDCYVELTATRVTLKKIGPLVGIGACSSEGNHRERRRTFGLLLPARFLTFCPMKTQRKQQRSISSISASRWTAYAAAAAATAIGLPATDAAIHYSERINEKFDDNRFEVFPLDPNGPAELQFRHNFHFYSTSVIDGGSARVFVAYGAPVGVSVSCALNTSQGSVLPLKRHAVISQQPFSSRASIIGTHGGYSCGGKDRGRFPGGVSLIGFKFNNGQGEQFGWARIKILEGALHAFKLVDYAYGDPGDRVRAGEISTGRFVDSLGALALGGAGVQARREISAGKLQSGVTGE